MVHTMKHGGNWTVAYNNVRDTWVCTNAQHTNSGWEMHPTQRWELAFGGQDRDVRGVGAAM